MADLANEPLRTSFSAYRGQLPLDIPLVSELLQEAGYRTYMEGKWHLGDLPGEDPGSKSPSPPNGRGFDYFIGFLNAQAAPYPRRKLNPYKINQGTMNIKRGWFAVEGMNELLMKQLTKQFETDPDSPFFIYFASQAVHRPLEAPTALIDKYQEVYDRPLQDLWSDRVSAVRNKGLFPADAPTIAPVSSERAIEGMHTSAARRAALLEAADAELGKLLQLLEDKGKLDNTLIIVASDNGGETPIHNLTNAPLTGAKGTLLEGGTRSALLARWPAGGIGANRVINQMTTYLDIMPTFLDVAGVSYPGAWRGGRSLPALEGRNLLPLLRGQELPPPEYFVWELNGNFAVLQEGRWKLMSAHNYDADKARRNIEPGVVLVDVIRDPAETVDLAPGQTDRVARLLARYRSWAERHDAVPYYKVMDERSRDQATESH